MKDSELVYVINLAGLEKMPGLQSNPFSRADMDTVGFSVALIEGFFMSRADAEEQPVYKQIIPYVIFTAEDDTHLVYQRQGSEARLVGKQSIGIGGHINPVDAEDCDWRSDMVAACVRRELLEELELKGLTAEDLAGRTQLKGLLYTADTPVDKVHLGVVYEVSVLNEHKAKFSMKSEGRNLRWLPASELLVLGDDLETWSRLILEN